MSYHKHFKFDCIRLSRLKKKKRRRNIPYTCYLVNIKFFCLMSVNIKFDQSDKLMKTRTKALRLTRVPKLGGTGLKFKS